MQGISLGSRWTGGGRWTRDGRGRACVCDGRVTMGCCSVRWRLTRGPGRPVLADKPIWTFWSLSRLLISAPPAPGPPAVLLSRRTGWDPTSPRSGHATSPRGRGPAAGHRLLLFSTRAGVAGKTPARAATGTGVYPRVNSPRTCEAERKRTERKLPLRRAPPRFRRNNMPQVSSRFCSTRHFNPLHPCLSLQRLSPASPIRPYVCFIDAKYLPARLILSSWPES